MPISIATREQLLQARYEELNKKSYVGLEGTNSSYLQTGHLLALSEARLSGNEDTALKTSNSILTAAEERASVIARLRGLTPGERERFELPEAGSAAEYDDLRVLSNRIDNLTRTKILQSQAPISQAASAELPTVTSLGH